MSSETYSPIGAQNAFTHLHSTVLSVLVHRSGLGVSECVVYRIGLVIHGHLGFTSRLDV